MPHGHLEYTGTGNPVGKLLLPDNLDQDFYIVNIPLRVHWIFGDSNFSIPI